MYLHNGFLTFAIGFILCFPLTATISIEQTPEDAIYYYHTVRAREYPTGSDMPSRTLMQYAIDAYNEMMSFPRPEWVQRHRKPQMVSAMWVPAEQVVIIASGAIKGSGNFGYHPANVPSQITALLRATAKNGQWSTDNHRWGGSCAEIVALSVYFYFFPDSPGLPSPTGAKIVTVGAVDLGAQPTVQEPCSGTVAGGGCLDFLRQIGMRWCGPNSPTDPMKKRDEASDSPTIKFECHGANTPADFADNQPAATSITNTSSWEETATAFATLMSADLGTATGMGDIPASAVEDSQITVSDTTLQTQIAPSPTSSPPTTSSTSATSTSSSKSRTSTPTPIDGSGVNSNPQDPYARAGPAAKPPA